MNVRVDQIEQAEPRRDFVAKYHFHRAIVSSVTAVMLIVGCIRPSWIGQSHRPVVMCVVICIWAVVNWPVVFKDRREALRR